MSEGPVPFDEFPEEEEKSRMEEARKGRGWFVVLLRVASGAALIAAWGGVALLLATRGFAIAKAPAPTALGGFKSGIPLIAIGVSYLVLLPTLRRTFWERALGVCVGAAFTLWGAEQYLDNKEIVGAIDDFVVVLFVFDLGLVIRQNLRK